ncbi:transposase [Anaerobutyricum hallii]
MIQISSKGTPIQLFVRITRSVKKKVNQYYIWNVKKWYGVPTASSGKCWRKYMMKMADM